MIYPSIAQLTNNNEKSRYSLVLAVAKRSRDITSKAIEQGKILNESAVKLATLQFAEGKCDYIEK